MRKTKAIKIENQNYTLVEITALKRSIIGLQLKHIFVGVKDGIKDIDSELDYYKMFTGILERIEPEKGAYLLRDIIINGIQFPVLDEKTYDECFGEFYHHQIDLVSEIISMNFGKSIDDIKKKLEKIGILTAISSVAKQKKLD